MVSNLRKIISSGRHDGTVVGTAASQSQGPWFVYRLWSLSVLRLHILPMSLWVSCGCLGFFPQSKHVRVRWINHAELPLRVRGLRKCKMHRVIGIGPGWDCGHCRMASFCTVGFNVSMIIVQRQMLGQGELACWTEYKRHHMPRNPTIKRRDELLNVTLHTKLVLDKLLKLKVDKCPGPDGFPSEV